jgi:hypothetical protein
MRRKGRQGNIEFLIIVIAVSLCLTVLPYMTFISATSGAYNTTGRLLPKQPTSSGPDNSSVPIVKNTTDFLIKLTTTQSAYTERPKY